MDLPIIPITVFNEMDVLEPKCIKCNTILSYGTNTKYDSRAKAHVCMKCGAILK